MESKPFILLPPSTEEHINPLLMNLLITDFISDNVKTNSVMYNPSDIKADLLPAIRSQINKKRKLRSIWQSTTNLVIKTLLNHQIRLVSDLLHSNREEEWSDFLGSIKSAPQVWSKL